MTVYAIWEPGMKTNDSTGRESREMVPRGYCTMNAAAESIDGGKATPLLSCDELVACTLEALPVIEHMDDHPIRCVA